jgi:hypothetical protein
MTVDLAEPAPDDLTGRIADVTRRALRLASGLREDRDDYYRRKDALLAELRAKDEADA